MSYKHFENLPNNWNLDKFENLAKITCGVAATPEYVDKNIGVPFFSASNVQKGLLDTKKVKYIPRELHERLTKNTKPGFGDVLMTRVGAGIGETAIVDIKYDFSVYVSLTLIKPNKKLNSSYVKYVLNTDYYRYLAIREQFAGGGVQNLNVQMVKNYLIAVPPLVEQQKIANILSTWDKAISTTERLIENSTQQKKALMQQLLTGKKRLLDNEGKRFEGEWEEGKLADFAKIKKGKALSSKDLKEGSYPVIAGGKSSPYTHSDFTHENIITVSASGAYAGYIAFFPYKIWASDCSVVEPKGDNNIKYFSAHDKKTKKSVKAKA